MADEAPAPLPAPAGDTPRPRRKLDREDTERRLIAAFDRVWTRDGIQGLGVNAVLKEAGVGKALLYRYFGDFVGLARAWAEGETFLPRPPSLVAGEPGATRRPQVALALAYARALRARPKTRELLIMELLRRSPITEALDDMRARFGREMRGFFTAAGAPEGEDAFALSFLVTAAMTYLALRADTVPDYYGLKLDREESWQRIEAMLDRIASRVLAPDAPTDAAPALASAPGPRPAAPGLSPSLPGASRSAPGLSPSAPAPASRPPRRRP